MTRPNLNEKRFEDPEGYADMHKYSEALEHYINYLEAKKQGQSVCDHEFVSREYIGQPYGTCVSCGETVIGAH